MPGIPFLDASTSYALAAFVSTFLVVVPVAVGMLEFLLLGWNYVRSARKGSKLRPSPPRVAAHVAVLALWALCVAYEVDGRYSQVDVATLTDLRGTYFGQARNGLPNGFGKVFDGEGRIAYAGFLSAGRRNGEGTEYAMVAGLPRPTYSGGIRLGKRSGEGRSIVYHDDTGTVDYEYVGSHRSGKACGYGTLTQYGDDGTVVRRYEGGWSDGVRCGYGVELVFEGDDAIESYRGLWWNNERFGNGVWEYTSSDGTRVVWRGSIEGGQARCRRGVLRQGRHPTARGEQRHARDLRGRRGRPA